MTEPSLKRTENERYITKAAVYSFTCAIGDGQPEPVRTSAENLGIDETNHIALDGLARFQVWVVNIGPARLYSYLILALFRKLNVTNYCEYILHLIQRLRRKNLRQRMLTADGSARHFRRQEYGRRRFYRHCRQSRHKQRLLSKYATNWLKAVAFPQFNQADVAGKRQGKQGVARLYFIG